MSIAKLLDLKLYVPKLFNDEPDPGSREKTTKGLRIKKIIQKPLKFFLRNEKQIF